MCIFALCHYSDYSVLFCFFSVLYCAVILLVLVFELFFYSAAFCILQLCDKFVVFLNHLVFVTYLLCTDSCDVTIRPIVKNFIGITTFYLPPKMGNTCLYSSAAKHCNTLLDIVSK